MTFFFHTLVSYSPYLMKKFLCILTKKTYFFYFTYSFFENTSHQIIYFTLYFFKILIFLDFFCCFSFFTNNNHHPLSSFILGIRKERIKMKYNMNNASVNLHRYCSNDIFLHNFA